MLSGYVVIICKRKNLHFRQTHGMYHYHSVQFLYQPKRSSRSIQKQYNLANERGKVLWFRYHYMVHLLDINLKLPRFSFFPSSNLMILFRRQLLKGFRVICITQTTLLLFEIWPRLKSKKNKVINSFSKCVAFKRHKSIIKQWIQEMM